MWGLERTRGGGGPVWTVDGAAVTACASAEGGGGGGGGRLWRHRPPPWGLGRAGWGEALAKVVARHSYREAKLEAPIREDIRHLAMA